MRDGQKKDFARKLRQEPTDAERVMWRLLRDRRLSGVKFRRQVPVGPYVVDFACVTARLAIELDGGQHAESDSDWSRDAHLRDLGWKVLRIWNSELYANREGVLSMVLREAGVRFDNEA